MTCGSEINIRNYLIEKDNESYKRIDVDISKYIAYLLLAVDVKVVTFTLWPPYSTFYYWSFEVMVMKARI